jgi:hypothetical protein
MKQGQVNLARNFDAESHCGISHEEIWWSTIEEARNKMEGQQWQIT